MSKRPKRSRALVHSKTMETVWYVSCPHCKTSCIGLADYIDRMRCWYCKEIIMIEWPEKAKAKDACSSDWQDALKWLYDQLDYSEGDERIKDIIELELKDNDNE